MNLEQMEQTTVFLIGAALDQKDTRAEWSTGILHAIRIFKLNVLEEDHMPWMFSIDFNLSPLRFSSFFDARRVIEVCRHEAEQDDDEARALKRVIELSTEADVFLDFTGPGIRFNWGSMFSIWRPTPKAADA